MKKKKDKNQLISLVIPVYNEEKALPLLFKSLVNIRKTLPEQVEIVFIDDGSTDQTANLIKKSKLSFKIKLIQLSRNFGHQAALLAGLRNAKGNYIVSLDGDLQHPPELLSKMLKLHQQGYEVVLTKRIDGQITNFSKKITAQLFYKFINLLSDTTIEANSSDFRSLSRKALEALLALPENRKFLRGMVQWIGFETVIIPFQVKQRVAGKSKYNLYKMLRLAIHGLASFSARPLFLAGFFSIFLFLMAIFYAFYVIYVRFYGSGIVEGWASVLFVTLVIGGFLSLFVGLLGVYIAAIYDEVKNRPEYIIEKIHAKQK